MQLIVFWVIFTLLQRVPAGSRVDAGLSDDRHPALLFWRGCISRGASATAANLPLLTYPQVKVFDVVLARVLLDLATFAIVTVIIIVGLRFLYGEPFTSWVRDPFVLGDRRVALLFFSLASSIFSANLARIWPLWIDIWSYINRPLYFASGIFFTLDSLPTGFRALAAYIPMAHLLEWIRTGAIPGFVSIYLQPRLRVLLSQSRLLVHRHEHRLGAAPDRPRRLARVGTHDRAEGHREDLPRQARPHPCAARRERACSSAGKASASWARTARASRPCCGSCAAASGRRSARCGATSPAPGRWAFPRSFSSSLTGAENLRFVCRIYGADIGEVTEFVAGFSELGPSINEPIKTYSTGMRSRLAFALSMAIRFQVYVIDEALASGDVAFQRKAIRLFEERKSGSDVIMVSHSISMVKQYCTRAGVLERRETHDVRHHR